MGDELTNAALIALIGAFGLALVLRGAGSASPRSWAATRNRKQARRRDSGCCSTPPTPPARSMPKVSARSSTGSSRPSCSVGSPSVPCGSGSCCAATPGRPRPTRTVLPGLPPRTRSRPRHHRKPSCIAPERCGHRWKRQHHGMLAPTRGQSRDWGVGVGGGLDPADRPAPLGQGPARRHQRDPRRTRSVVTTSTRPDNLTATLRARRRQGGPVAVFDPQRLAEGIPAGLRWSPVRGCEDPLTAMIRANGLAAATGLSSGGVESSRVLGRQNPHRTSELLQPPPSTAVRPPSCSDGPSTPALRLRRSRSSTHIRTRRWAGTTRWPR